MVATHIKKIKHNMLCMTGVYLRDITRTVFVILHFNVSCLSICTYCSKMPVSVVNLYHVLMFTLLCCVWPWWEVLVRFQVSLYALSVFRPSFLSFCVLWMRVTCHMWALSGRWVASTSSSGTLQGNHFLCRSDDSYAFLEFYTPCF